MMRKRFFFAVYIENVEIVRFIAFLHNKRINDLFKKVKIYSELE